MAEYQLLCWKDDYRDPNNSNSRRIKSEKVGDFTSDADWDGDKYVVFEPGKKNKNPYDLQKFRVYWDPLLESGTHNGTNNASTLTDTTKSWTAGAFVGLYIYNTTDGSYGEITANTSTTITVNLKKGGDNDWDTGDAYQIGQYYTGEQIVSYPTRPENDIVGKYRFFDDFLGADLDWDIWTEIKVGGQSSLVAIVSDYGVIRIRSGQSSGDFETLTNSLKDYKASHNPIIKMGIKLDHTTDLAGYFGFYDDASNSIEFKADTSLGYWVCQNIAGGVSTSFTTSVALDTSWHHLEIRIMPTIVQYFIDGVFVKEHTDNIPSVAMYFRAQIARTAGSVVRDGNIDYVEICGERSY